MIKIHEEDRRLVKDDGNVLWEEVFARQNPSNIYRSEKILFSPEEEQVVLSKLALVKVVPDSDRLKSNLVTATAWMVPPNNSSYLARLGNEMLVDFVSGKVEGISPTQNSFIVSCWLVPRRVAEMAKNDFRAELQEIQTDGAINIEMNNLYDKTLECMRGRYNRNIKLIMMFEAQKESGVKLRRADLVTRALRYNLREEGYKNVDDNVDDQEITP